MEGENAALKAQLAAQAQENQGLRAQVDQLSHALQALQFQVGRLQTAWPPPAPKIPMAVPARFTGVPSELETFVARCRLYIQVRAQDFPNERAQVAFMISLLSGMPAKWATPLLRQNSGVLDDMATFLQAFRAVWGDSVRVETASRQLRQLQQGWGSVRDYTTTFRLLAQEKRLP